MKNKIYRCEICGNIVEKLHDSGVNMVCCGQEMTLVPEKTLDVGNEKHVPVIIKTNEGVKVKVGDIEHPMLDNHYIMWIELLTESGNFKAFLKPGMPPEALFPKVEGPLRAREYCNLHGLWSSK